MTSSQDLEIVTCENENAPENTVPKSHIQDIRRGYNELNENQRELLANIGRDLKYKNERMQRYYRPISHGRPFLLVLITILLVAAGLIELAVRTLPVKEDDDPTLQHRNILVNLQRATINPATMLTTTPVVDECTITLTQPVVIETVTKTAIVPPTETTTKTAIVVETIESTLTVKTTIVQRATEITSNTLLARQACITVIASAENTQTVTIDPSDYAQTGTVTITMTQTLVIGRTETATITQPDVPHTTATWIPDPTPKGTLSITTIGATGTSAAQEVHTSTKSSPQISIGPVVSSTRAEQVTVTIGLPSSLGGNTVIVIPANSLATPTGGSEIWSDRGGGDVTSTSGIKSTAISDFTVTIPKTGQESLFATAYPPTEGFTATWSAITTVLTDFRGIPTSTSIQEALFFNMLKTLTDNHGSATATVSYSGWIVAQTTTIIDSEGKPSLTVTRSLLVSPYTTIMKDDLGNPTATLTLSSAVLLPDSTPTQSQQPSKHQGALLTTILSDSDGNPTTTITFHSISDNTTMTTLRVSNKLPTATVTAPGSGTTTITQISTAVFTISSTQYFTGMFLATLLATLIAIPIRLIDLNAKRLQPFHAMTRADGAQASESLLMNIGGIDAFLAGFKALRVGDILISITNLLMVSSALLAPLAAEGISIAMHGDCNRGSMNTNCALSLAVSKKSARAAECILFIMAALTFGALIVLRRWHSGVERDPWSMEGLGSLLTHPETQMMIASVPFDGTKIPNSEFKKILGEACFRLEFFPTRDGLEYGIIARQSSPSESISHSRATLLIPMSSSFRSNTNSEPSFNSQDGPVGHCQTIFALRVTGLVLQLTFLLGLSILIVTYNNTGGPTGFEYFMDSETFGVRFLFTSLGVLTLYLFSGVFSGICTLMPYKAFSSTSSHSIYSRPPPTNSFEALWSSLRASPRSPLLFITSILNITAEFLPVLLANVPYRTTQTYITHMVCTWLCVAILCFLILHILYLLCFVRWPALPADVRTVAGAAWYLMNPDVRTHYGSQVEKLTTIERDGSMVKTGKVVIRGEGQHLLHEDVNTSGNNYF